MDWICVKLLGSFFESIRFSDSWKNFLELFLGPKIVEIRFCTSISARMVLNWFPKTRWLIKIKKSVSFSLNCFTIKINVQCAFFSNLIRSLSKASVHNSYLRKLINSVEKDILKGSRPRNIEVKEIWVDKHSNLLRIRHTVVSYPLISLFLYLLIASQRLHREVQVICCWRVMLQIIIFKTDVIGCILEAVEKVMIPFRQKENGLDLKVLVRGIVYLF